MALRCRTPLHRGHLGTGKPLSFVKRLLIDQRDTLRDASEYGQRSVTAAYNVQDFAIVLGAKMSARSSKQVIQDAWRAFGSRDPARIAAVFTEQAEWLAPEGNATAVALKHTNHMVGRDAIVRFLTEEFPKLFVGDVSVDIEGIYADGQTVILQERMRATLLTQATFRPRSHRLEAVVRSGVLAPENGSGKHCHEPRLSSF